MFRDGPRASAYQKLNRGKSILYFLERSTRAFLTGESVFKDGVMSADAYNQFGAMHGTTPGRAALHSGYQEFTAGIG